MATSLPRDRFPAGISFLLLAVVFFVFSQSISHDFVDYDDGDYVFANAHVQAGLSWNGAAWAFRTVSANNWHPLTWLSLMADATVFKGRPSGFHLTNVLLHSANTWLLFLLLRRLTGAQWRSALVAALFALHPLHVESVAWVSERKDVLSGLFFLLTLLAYEKYARKVDPVAGGLRHSMSCPSYWAVFLLFALGLLSKPMLVTLPFVLLCLDWWPLRRGANLDSRPARWRFLFAEKIPFFALSAVSCVITLVAQGNAVQPLTRLTLGVRAVNACVSYARYLSKMFWPSHLAIPYPHNGYWPVSIFVFSLVLLLATTILAFHFRRRLPFLITGWFWYLGMLVPVIGLVQVGGQSLADRYTYLPLIGVFVILVWGAAEVLARLPRAAVWSLSLLVVTACAARTWDQLRYWKNSETLFRHSIAVTAGNQIACYDLGEFYLNQNRLDDAITWFQAAVQLDPRYDDALNNLGVALAMKGDLAGAAAQIQTALQLNPNKADAYFNLGNVLVLQKKLAEAADAYTGALRLKPDYAEAHNNLANILVMQGQRDAAILHYRETVRFNPAHESAQRHLRELDSGYLP